MLMPPAHTGKAARFPCTGNHTALPVTVQPMVSEKLQGPDLLCLRKTLALRAAQV